MRYSFCVTAPQLFLNILNISPCCLGLPSEAMGSGASSDKETADAYKRIVYTSAATPRGDKESSTLSVTVQFLGGESQTKVCVSSNAKVGELKSMVEGNVCRLIFKGKVLQDTSSVLLEGIRDGDLLTAAVGNVQKLQAIKRTSEWASDSFALLRCDGTVSTWGEPKEGGDSSYAQDRLQQVVDIVGSQSAFTALRSDGEIVPRFICFI